MILPSTDIAISREMSILGRLRRAKHAAEKQKDKQGAAAEDSQPKPPYRHVPTHAATDALLGAPATWRDQDKKAIQAQNQRRSQYHHLSRNPSSLSNVTTLNRDQSFMSMDRTPGAIDQGKHYSADWTGTTHLGQYSQPTSIGRSSTTNFSRRSQLLQTGCSAPQPDRRKGRFDTAEPTAPARSGTNHHFDGPDQTLSTSSKDVNFYLPSSRGE